jgi:hypothetical protein
VLPTRNPGNLISESVTRLSYSGNGVFTLLPESRQGGLSLIMRLSDLRVDGINLLTIDGLKIQVLLAGGESIDFSFANRDELSLEMTRMCLHARGSSDSKTRFELFRGETVSSQGQVAHQL